MNTETMITELKSVAEKHKNDKLFTFQTNITAMCGDIIPKLEQLAEYEAIGTVEECREAREKQRGKKPILSAPCKSINYYLCPDCGEILRINRPFCSKCGSAIDWSDTP